MWPAYPTLRTDDVDFKALVALLLDGHIAVLAGNPSHIEGPSPLKRVGDVGHAIALLRARRAQGRPRDPRRRPVPPGRQAPARRVDRRQAGAPVRLPRLGTSTPHGGLGRALRRLDGRAPDGPAEGPPHRPHRGGTPLRQPGRPRGPSSASGPASKSSRRAARSTARRSSPRRSTPSASPSATSSMRGGRRERPSGTSWPGSRAGCRASARPSRCASARSRS